MNRVHRSAALFFIFFFPLAYMSSVLYVVSAAIKQYNTLHLVGKLIIKSLHQLVAAL